MTTFNLNLRDLHQPYPRDWASMMTKEEVIALMASSLSEDEWNSNCDTVKSRCGGYPNFWWEQIIKSGLGDRTAAKWGGDMEMHIYSI